MTNITFVNDDDNVIGSGTKQEAWKNGTRHRIARIFLFNSKNELLIQKRSDSLSSLPGKWDQSAAGHVDEGETYLEAAQREMEEEIGVSNIPLREVKKTKSDETDESGKIKKRFNMIFTARYDGEIKFNDEVSETRWIMTNDLLDWMDKKPDDFTEGFKRAFRELIKDGRAL